MLNPTMLVAAILNAIAAFLHLGCIFFGAPWYRFFGAGEHMASLAEQGSVEPTIITSIIFLVLMTWSAYAYSGAGGQFKLPFTRPILLLITLAFLLRGVAGFFLIDNPLGRTPEFWVWSSTICLIYGGVHAFGLKQVWYKLR